jgi:hypothetical protein
MLNLRFLRLEIFGIATLNAGYTLHFVGTNGTGPQWL